MTKEYAVGTQLGQFRKSGLKPWFMELAEDNNNNNNIWVLRPFQEYRTYISKVGENRSTWLLVVLGLTALWDNISVYIGPSPREREEEKRSDRWEKKCPNNPHPHLMQAQ